MSWQASYPNKIYFGSNAIEDSAHSLAELGKKALIVIGQGGSARKNGALDDLCKMLQKHSIGWEIFDQVEANPGIDTVRAGAQLARNCMADFIIGIGGGSPLDAAKAIAILAVNDLNNDELLNIKFEKVLPVASIPTTAGTGSEVTPYSILTFPVLETKKNIATPKIIPKLAILDPAYTQELPARVTVDTAVDAYSHALESYLSVRATSLSELYASEALHILGDQLRMLAGNTIPDSRQREQLLYASMLAGMAISTTGTSIPHAMGYYLTFFKEITHGRANGMIMPAYMEFNLRKTAHPKVHEVLKISGFDSLESFQMLMYALCDQVPALNPAEKQRFIEQTLQAKNLVNNLVKPDQEDLEAILEYMLT